ncbi:MAG: MCE family protein [Mycobacteriaceae bacterium]
MIKGESLVKKVKALWKTYPTHRLTWIGGIGVFVIIGTIGSLFLIKEAGITRQTYTAEFSQAAGIRPGDSVRIAGVEVGEVSGTELVGGRVEVAMSLKRELNLGDTTKASIKLSTLLGARYVEIKPAGNGDSNLIPLQNTEVPYDLAKTIETGTPIFAGIDGKALEKSLEALNSELKNSPELTAEALDGIGTLSGVIADRKEQVGRLLKDINEITSTLYDSRFDIMVLIAQGQDLGQKIMKRQEILVKLLDAVSALGNQLTNLANEDEGNFGQVISELELISEGLKKNEQNLINIVQLLPVTSRHIANSLGSGNWIELTAPWGFFPDNWLCLAQVIQGCQ